MVKLDREWVQPVLNHHLQEDLYKGNFGLEKENNRVDEQGRLALTPHPEAFGGSSNPYIRRDFSESQIEMVTPVMDSVDQAHQFLETIHDIVSLELGERHEYLWPCSNPPAIPDDERIPIARSGHPKEDEYRMMLARKYGRKRQLISGLHMNYSLQDSFLRKLHIAVSDAGSFKDFKDRIYLKIARHVLKYRWLLVYLTGASPVFNRTYMDECVRTSDYFDEESFFFPHMYSMRNSACGYRNMKELYVSYDSTAAYLDRLQQHIRSGELISEREYYSPVRLKPAAGNDFFKGMQEEGIAYLELRMIDLNPFHKIGISRETLQFIHLFLIFMLMIEDEPYGEEEQRTAAWNLDSLLMNGIGGQLYGGAHSRATLQAEALAMVDGMKRMIRSVLPHNGSRLIDVVEMERRKVADPERSFASLVKNAIRESSYLRFHMEKAKRYAKESREAGYVFHGLEDMELSTQLLLKAAIKRGITCEILDREENFIALTKDGRREYVKQATKTSLDPYSTVLLMENKVVTKKVLKRHGIRVPEGQVYSSLEAALADFDHYRGTPIVIKPKNTNFGLGVTIFTGNYSPEDYRDAFILALSHDRAVLLEHYVPGKEYRFLVMGDDVVGVLQRVPANVTGDGIHTIEQLVALKNKDPLRGKGYRTPLERIELGEAEELFLRNQSRCRTDIPKLGEAVYLRENSNISTGGDSLDYTDALPGSYKEIAVRAAQAAGATFCGVDMIIADIRQVASGTNYCVIEINFNPAIHIHCYPYQGKNRRADEKILDLLFGTMEQESLREA